MRMAAAIVALCLTLPAGAADVQLPCPAGASCPTPSAEETKQAAEKFQHALKLQKSGKHEEALLAFEDAARLSPRNVEYLTAREISRQQLVYQHLQQGNELTLLQKPVAAAVEFRQALYLDPSNTFAQERLREALDTSAPKREGPLRFSDDTGPITVRPKADRAAFHYRGDTRGLLTQVAQAFGVKTKIDESVRARPVRFDLDSADFAIAMGAAAKVTHTFWVPLAANQIFIADNTRANHQTYDRMVMRTFYLSDITSAQELTEIVNVLRTLFEIRFITQQAGNFSIAVRGPQPAVEAATTFLEASSMQRPQVMLDVQVFQVSHSLAREIGLDLPLQWSMFNISPSLLASLGASTGTNIQDLIDQLFASGGINQSNTTALTALLAQLQSQQTSIFRDPVATFGKGISMFGVPFLPASANFSFDESNLRSLQHVSIRAGQNLPATIRIGTRYPILNATFAPIFNSSALTSVIGSGNFVQPFPSFTYEDLGVNLKATPRVQGDLSVSLDLELQIRSLSAASLNGVPVIANREYKGNVIIANGQMAAVVGAMDQSDSRVLKAPIGIGQIPVLGRALSNESVERREDELLIVITPHVIRAPETGARAWIPLS